jgi:tetratricopeptide (TPR) repeat protein
MICTAGIIAVLLFSEKFELLFERTVFAIVSVRREKRLSLGVDISVLPSCDAYDIRAADYFFERAALLDPKYPYVYHQLARIAFLKNDLPTALARINLEIENHGDTEANAYYMRGLIEGYAGDYAAAARDYTYYLDHGEYNWAGVNDYAWVLMKAGRSKEAIAVLEKGVDAFPQNAWLLNSYATALYEVGDTKKAAEIAQRALNAVMGVTDEAWLMAYPGNDPRTSSKGIQSFKDAVIHNLDIIASASSSKAVQ